ncbi:MAG: recombinase family protein [Rhizobiales bacterium]|nr:recombinase family protein [Hyphomicrobiales bacterium]
MRIGYARVSTDEQNLRLQLDALRAAGCERIYRDDGISAVARDRPGLRRAIKRLKSGDVLVVWKLDRLGRSLAHLIEVITGLRDDGVGFHSLSEAIDTTTPGGRLIFHVMGALAEFERELIAERTRAGMSAAKRAGIRLGRPLKLTAAQVEKAQARIDAGETVAGAAASLEVNQTTLARALRRRREGATVPI